MQHGTPLFQRICVIFFKQNFLKKELSKLYEKGLLSKEQKEKIFTHYHFTQSSNSLLFAILAAILFSLSLITLMGFNWEKIPAILRTVLLLSLLLASQITLFCCKDKSKVLAEILGVVSNFILLANLALLSQIYHLGDDTPLMLLSVAFVSLLSAFVLRSYFVFMQAYFLAVLAFGVNLDSDIFTYPFGIFIALGFILQTINAYKLLAFANFTFLCLYFSSLCGKLQFTMLFTAPLLSFFLLALNAKSYRFYALLVCAAVFLSYASFGDFMQPYYIVSSIFSFLIQKVFLFIFCFLSLFLFLLKKRLFLAFLALAFYFESFGFLTEILHFFTAEIKEVNFKIIIQIYYSFLSLILSVYFIKNNEKILGILTLFVLVIIRYVELLGDYIGASILFALFGLILLFVAQKGVENES